MENLLPSCTQKSFFKLAKNCPEIWLNSSVNLQYVVKLALFNMEWIIAHINSSKLFSSIANKFLWVNKCTIWILSAHLIDISLYWNYRDKILFWFANHFSYIYNTWKRCLYVRDDSISFCKISGTTKVHCQIGMHELLIL